MTLHLKEPHPKYPECDDCSIQYNHVLRSYIDTYCDLHQERVVPTPDKRKANPDTEYAFTLTMPPTYVPKKPIEETARLILTNGLTSKPYEKITEWAYVLEHTEQGTPHIHGVYKTPSGRRIEQKYFKRYWDLWDEKVVLGNGHKGGYHQKVRHGESLRAYMEKEGVVCKNLGSSQVGLPDPLEIISHA